MTAVYVCCPERSSKLVIVARLARPAERALLTPSRSRVLDRAPVHVVDQVTSRSAPRQPRRAAPQQPAQLHRYNILYLVLY